MAEYLKNKGCPQKDSAEHEGYAGARRSFRRIWKERNSAQPSSWRRYWTGTT
jgi:RNA-directed DNA polymerase